MQQLHLRTLDKTEFKKATLQLDFMFSVMTMAAHLDDDAAFAASGLAQLYSVGQFKARTSGRRPRRLRVSLTVIIRCAPSPSSRTP